MANQKVKLSLKFKIILAIVAAVLVTGGISVLLVTTQVTKSLLDAKKTALKDVAIEQSHETAFVLSRGRNMVDVLAKDIRVVNYFSKESGKTKKDNEDILRVLFDYGLARQFFSNYLMDLSGNTLVSTDPTFLDKNFGFREYFKKAASGGTHEELAIGSVTNALGIFFSAPVIATDSGKVIGVVAAKLDPSQVFETLHDSTLTKSGYYFVVDKDGVVVASNKKDVLYKSMGQLSDETLNRIKTSRTYLGKNIEPLQYGMVLPLIANYKLDTKVIEYVDKVDKENELINVVKLGQFPMFVVSEIGYDSLIDSVNVISMTLGVFVLLALIIGTAFQYGVVSWLLSPLFKLSEYSDKVSAGDLEADVQVKSGDELEVLANNIKEMVMSIKKYYSELEQKVKEQTKEVVDNLKEIEDKNIELEDTKKAIVNVMEDLNEEKDRMYDEKNRIETILASIGDGVFVTDENGYLTMMNRAAQTMSGYGLIEALGKHYTKIFKFVEERKPDNQYPDIVGEVIKKGIVSELMPYTVLVSKEGTQLPVLDSAAPVRDPEGKVSRCVVVIRDNSKERELDRSKDDFISVTSHQLRTPLGSMRWNLEMLRAGDAGEISEEAKAVADELYAGNLRMIELVNNLLNVSRIDQGRVVDQPEVTDLSSIIDKSVKEMKLEAVNRKVKVSVRKVDKLPKVYLDPEKFREIMENLLSNAIKYNKKGGKVKISMKVDAGYVVVTVADTGLGIPKKDIQRIFSKFFRASNAVHSETEGTGLGLYVVKKIVEGWGGKVRMESKEGEGTKFSLFIPKNIEYKKKIEK